MGGIIVDIIVLGVIAGFAMVGAELGLVRSLIRLVAVVGAGVLAVVLIGPIGWLIGVILPGSADFSRLVALVLVGAATYLSIATIVSWYADWVPHERVVRMDRALGAIPSIVIGLLWTGLMISLLVMSPSPGIMSKWPIASVPGAFITQHSESSLRWLYRNFPHYTMALPKAPLRGTVEAATDLQFGGTPDPQPAPDDAGALLGYLNDARSRNDAPEFTWNSELADEAQVYSRQMFTDGFLGTRAPQGIRFSDRMRLALGGNAELYCSSGAVTVWAHSAVSAYAAIMDNQRTRKLVLGKRFIETGIGAQSAGWFNGMMFTVALVGDRLDPVRIANENQTCATLRLTRPGGSASSAADPSSTPAA